MPTVSTRSVWGSAAFFAAITISAQLLDLRELWQFTHDTAISSRVFTAHLVHSSWSHLALNLLALALSQALFACSWDRLIVIYLTAAIVICLGVYVMQVEFYFGLSGIVHAWLAYGAIMSLSRHDRMTGYLVLIGLGIKLVVELTSGPSERLEQWIGSQILTEAHLLGTISGLCLAVLYTRLSLHRTLSKQDFL